MRRKSLARLLIVVLVSLSSGPFRRVVAAPPVVLEARAGMADVKPQEMLHRWLLSESRNLLVARAGTVAKLKSPEQIANRQKAMKAYLMRSLGDLPDRAPLNGKTIGSFDRRDYRVERIVFESRPRHHVTASLYIPRGSGPFPGVLVPCGHSANGKASEAYQRICMLLATNGLAALCYDPIGQGERVQMLDPGGNPTISAGSTTEHTLAGIGALLVGRQLASYRVWDGLRAMDYLASRREIDPARLACTGNSGGGTMTAYLMSLDDRIAVAAPSCFITSLGRLFSTIGPQDAEQNILGQVAAGLDHADYVTIRAPKPTLISAGTQDFFDIQGTWDSFREAKLLYGRLGFGERVDLFESDEPHGFTSPRRVATVRWMRRWLLRIDDAILEDASAPIETDAGLQCTTSGQVMREFDDISVFGLNAERDRRLEAVRRERAVRQNPREFRSEIRKRLALPSRLPEARFREVGRRAGAHGEVHKLLTTTEPGITLSLHRLEPEWLDASAPTVLVVGGDDAIPLARGSECSRLLGEGRRVILVEVRGASEKPPGKGGRDRGSLLGDEVGDAFLAMHIGRPLPGQRILDLLVVMEALKREIPDISDTGIELHGTGPAAEVALHAAILDESGLVRKVTLERLLVSWSDVVRRGLSRRRIGGVIPGVLECYDLPDLVARLAPTHVVIRSVVDAMGEPVAGESLREIYASCRAAFGARGSLELPGGH